MLQLIDAGGELGATHSGTHPLQPVHPHLTVHGCFSNGQCGMHAPPVAEGEGDGGGRVDAKLESEHSGEHPLQPAQVHLKHASGGVDVSTGTFLVGVSWRQT